MVRRMMSICGLAVALTFVVGVLTAAEPVTVYQANLMCGDLASGDLGSMCMSDPFSRGVGWAQGWVEGDVLFIRGQYRDLTGPVMKDVALGVHLHHDPATYHVDTLIRGFANNGGTSGTFEAAIPLTDAYRAMLDDGRLYIDIHTTAFPEGELKGMLVATSVWSTQLR